MEDELRRDQDVVRFLFEADCEKSFDILNLLAMMYDFSPWMRRLPQQQRRNQQSDFKGLEKASRQCRRSVLTSSRIVKNFSHWKLTSFGTWIRLRPNVFSKSWTLKFFSRLLIMPVTHRTPTPRPAPRLLLQLFWTSLQIQHAWSSTWHPHLWQLFWNHLTPSRFFMCMSCKTQLRHRSYRSSSHLLVQQCLIFRFIFLSVRPIKPSPVLVNPQFSITADGTSQVQVKASGNSWSSCCGADTGTNCWHNWSASTGPCATHRCTNCARACPSNPGAECRLRFGESTFSIIIV